ncbi:TetR/AcrR family transcriptional regulator [Maricurvus nonylphenolicus]|uniref:TetR/AcrR family transcriptional regulator n=1 Tax=Maricurvus nonylphenolicus TaxID=1008307 RepID=UPI0036F2EF7F
MARPTEFDRQKALQAAMHLFWRQGYTATSLRQLLTSMEISRSSLYAAFGDKRQLFIEALHLFSDRTYAILAKVREETNPAIAIRLFFAATLFEVPSKRMHRGCMMINSVLELADVDQGLSQLASQRLADIEDAFTQCFQQAIDSGLMKTEKTPKQLAQFIMTINQGLRVAARQQVDPKELENIIDTTLPLLGI